MTWQIRRVLAWQSSVTTVREGQMWEDMKIKAVTNVTFITKERVCLSWPVSPVSLHTVNSSSSTSATTQVSGLTVHTDGGCRVILLRWHIGVERLLEVVSAHAGWTTHAQQENAVTVMRMTKYGVKTAGFLTDKTKLPVKQLRFGDTGDKRYNENGYHTLGKFKCYGTA